MPASCLSCSSVGSSLLMTICGSGLGLLTLMPLSKEGCLMITVLLCFEISNAVCCISIEVDLRKDGVLLFLLRFIAVVVVREAI